MTKSFTLTIPGTPVAQPRHRISTRGGFAKTYLPSDHPVHAFKQSIFLHSAGRGLFVGPVAVTIRAYFPMPASWSQKKKRAHALRWHTQKPDGDNIAKAVLDALADHWTDDCQVAYLTVLKRWTNGTGLTEIRVSEIQEDVGSE